jgi:hypothetical protein
MRNISCVSNSRQPQMVLKFKIRMEITEQIVEDLEGFLKENKIECIVKFELSFWK